MPWPLGMARIAFLLPNMTGGGAERVALTLMRAFLDRGHEVDLVLMSASGELMTLLPDGVRLFDLKARRVRNLLWPLVRYFRERRPDAMQASMWPVTTMAILARLLSRSPARIVVSDHSCLSQAYRGQPIVTVSLRMSVRALYPLADARIAVSAGVADDLGRLSGLDAARWTVIHNPVPAPAEPAVDGAGRDSAAWPAGAARVLTVGRLKHAKNHALLLRAFARVPRERTAHLVILGEGELRADLERLAAELGISDRVSMPGFIADPTPYYRSADLFVLSSDHEGYGNVLVEALHAGLAVVSTDCPAGPREILEGGGYGKLVSCNDPDALAAAIVAALDDTVDKDAQRRRAAELSGDHVVDEYLSLLLPQGKDVRATAR